MQICFDTLDLATKAGEWRNISLLISTQLIRAKSSSGLASVRHTFNNLDLQCFLKGSAGTLLLQRQIWIQRCTYPGDSFHSPERKGNFYSWDRALSSSDLRNAKIAIKPDNWTMDHLYLCRWRNKLQEQTRTIQMIWKKIFLKAHDLHEVTSILKKKKINWN